MPSIPDVMMLKNPVAGFVLFVSMARADIEFSGWYPPRGAQLSERDGKTGYLEETALSVRHWAKNGCAEPEGRQ